MDTYQQFIYKSRYSRWLPDEQRRENWDETVKRYVNFFDQHSQHEFSEVLNSTVYNAILTQDVMPSMRALMSAGPALTRDNIAGYNCSYLAINNKRSFAEALYILMCGTGVGFSCERQEIAKLPRIPDNLTLSNSVISVADSKEGWAKAFHALLSSLWNGDIPKVDYSLVRPAGARLKTFGGRASGHQPLKRLFEFTINMFKAQASRKLTSIEVHDLMCMVGDIVVVGGVRRSALISLSNLSDQRMRAAKTGQWWVNDPQRGLANNSVAYTEKPEIALFLQEWVSLIESKSGERGIFNREAAQKQAARWGTRSPTLSYGTNPCGEIILRDKQFCNLSTCIVRSTDTVEDLTRKVEIATIIGTFQSTLNHFKFISDQWRTNTSEERLLGVSLTGIMDNPLLSSLETNPNLPALLEQLRDVATATNIEWAAKLGIPASTAITCIKPEGTVSQLCDTSSGIHSRHSSQYIRTVRLDKKDPLYSFMLSKGFSIEDEVNRPESTAVVSFPIQAPEGAVIKDSRTAIEELELWLIYRKHWCHHNPSVTVSVRESEWLHVGAWVYENFDEISGISFLPHSDHSYQQAPYQAMTAEEFQDWVKLNPTPDVDWNDLVNFEFEDNTTSSQTLACSSGSCELV